MTFGRVIGRVWASAKNRSLEGLRMLIVQPLTPDLKPTGRRIIVTDSVGAGAGELVYWVGGKEASFPFLPAEAPADQTIVGIVDEVHVGQADSLRRTVSPPPGRRPAKSKEPA